MICLLIITHNIINVLFQRPSYEKERCVQKPKEEENLYEQIEARNVNEEEEEDFVTDDERILKRE